MGGFRFMSVLDWGKIAKKSTMGQNPWEKQGATSFSDFVAKSTALHEAQKAQQDAIAEAEPALRKALLLAMLNKSTITVKTPIQNWTESAGGQSEEDEDDGFYQNIQKSKAITANPFQVVQEIIPAGISLVYKSQCKELGQFLFKGSNGKVYTIYTGDRITLDDKAGVVVKNSGLFGLLYNTDIVDSVG